MGYGFFSSRQHQVVQMTDDTKVWLSFMASSIDLFSTNCPLPPPPPPPNTATRTTLTHSRDMFSLKTWTVSPAITRTKTRNSTRGILQLRLQFNYPDEFGTQKKVSSEAVPLTKEQRSLPNDATQLASNDSKWAQFINIPLSAETFSARVLDTKSPTDFLGFFAHLRVKSNEALDVDEIFLEE